MRDEPQHSKEVLHERGSMVWSVRLGTSLQNKELYTQGYMQGPQALIFMINVEFHEIWISHKLTIFKRVILSENLNSLVDANFKLKFPLLSYFTCLGTYEGL